MSSLTRFTRWSAAIVVVALAIACGPEAQHAQRWTGFAVFGDMEPSPEPEFIGAQLATDAVAQVAAIAAIADVVVSVGDIAHRGADVQYANVAPILQALPVPFLAIPGNEEAGDFDRFLKEASTWNEDPATIPDLHYVVPGTCFTLVFATATVDGRELADADVNWLLERLDEVALRRAILVTHGSRASVFEVGGVKGIENPRFRDEVLTHPALALTVSGDLHLDVASYPGIAATDGVVHLHAPGLERTKHGDHVPRMRTVSTACDGTIDIRTYDLQIGAFLADLSWTFRAGDPPELP